jgi:hypothetical protein
LHAPITLSAAQACGRKKMTVEEIATPLLTIVNRLRYRSVEG